jgi:hypothetical protein
VEWGDDMMPVVQLQREIEALPEKEFSRLRLWFAEKDWERWDQQRGRSKSGEGYVMTGMGIAVGPV